MLGSNRNQEERSDYSEAKPRWREAPDTPCESMVTVTGGSKRPGTYSVYTTDGAGRGWVRHMFGRRSGVLCVLSLIYILWLWPIIQPELGCVLNRNTYLLFKFNNCLNVYIFFKLISVVHACFNCLAGMQLIVLAVLGLCHGGLTATVPGRSPV